jgi:1-aminocyclopropane-1-carboxylate deaminase/D-cysteine desulfhydrase-like pyridoxal-dependent ACC family enzyme
MKLPTYWTPLEELKRTSKELNAEIWVKRDDLFPLFYGGNKARKILYILSDADKDGYNAIVTAGSPSSNHARVCALAAAKKGWRCSIIVHPEDPSTPLQMEGNLMLVKLAGADVKIFKLSDVGKAMDAEMERLRSDGYKPLYIWGGGHCVEGTFAYYEAVEELKKQMEDMRLHEPDFIVVPSGTGSTHAGIHLGADYFLHNCKVIGVSVARKRERGQEIVENSITELISHHNLANVKKNEVVFKDNFIGSGYGETLPEVKPVIKRMIKSEALVLDPIYSAKAFYGLISMIEKGEIPKSSRIIFWHTGGIINLLSSKNSIQ